MRDRDAVGHVSRTRVQWGLKAFKGVGHYVRLDVNGLDAVSGDGVPSLRPTSMAMSVLASAWRQLATRRRTSAPSSAGRRRAQWVFFARAQEAAALRPPGVAGHSPLLQ